MNINRRVSYAPFDVQREVDVTFDVYAGQRGAPKHRRHKAYGRCVELLTEFYDMNEEWGMKETIELRVTDDQKQFIERVAKLSGRKPETVIAVLLALSLIREQEQMK